MKIVLINASPRMETGNTQIILTPFMLGAKEAGASVDLVVLARKNIKECIGCFSCYAKTPGRCVHDDAMPKIMDRIKAADMLVLATPVYIDGMTSLAKKFVDRMVTFLDPHFVTENGRIVHPLRYSFPKKMFIISVCGYPGLHNFDPMVLHFEKICKNFSSFFCGALLRPAIFSILLTKKYPERVRNVLDSVRSAGRELVTDGVVSPETLGEVAADICSEQELIHTANAYWDRELKTTEQ
ncbi:MAG: flavodoxin family protein [Pseudomonadota bacterium]